MARIGSLFLAALVGGGFGTAIVNFLLDRLKEKSTAQRGWKEAALRELYGPLILHFDRTQRALHRYREADLFLEAEVLKASNESIRNLLLENGQYITPDLISPAGRLIEHYDVWLAEYHRARKPDSVDESTKFVFAGPQGYRFPADAELTFREKAFALQADLYDHQPAPRSPDRPGYLPR